MAMLAVKIDNLYKEYRLGIIGHGTLYRDLQSWWAKLRDKEDPNSLLGINTNRAIKNRILALNDLSLDIDEGEVLGIIGANGAGKSTLLKVLSRITAPTRGTVKVKGRIASLLEVGTGFHPELTGRENIYLNGAINGMNREEVSQKLNDIVEFSGVGKFIDTPVKRYSSGMNVRLGFSVAAHLDPDVLVVDEVLAVGDAAFRQKAIDKMKDVSKGGGRTVLFVSHNMEAIKSLCERVVHIENGRIVNDGDPDNVINSYLELSGQTKTGSEIVFKESSEKDYQVCSFGVIDDKGKKTDYLDRTKLFKIYIQYILRKPSEELFVQFDIKTASQENGVNIDTSVLGWSDKHYRRYKFGDENIDKVPGTYTAYITIPGYLLNSGSYKLGVGLVYLDNWYEKSDQYVLFELYDLGSSHLFTTGRRSGLLAMPLDWEVMSSTNVEN